MEAAAVGIIPQSVYSPVLSLVRIRCPQTFMLGSLLDTGRSVAHTSGDTGHVLVCFLYIALPLENVALRLDAFDTQNECT